MSRDALVVGINKYQGLPSLKAPANDAGAIADLLQTHGEFRVQRVPEIIQAHRPVVGQRTAVTARTLENALVQLFKPSGRNIPQTALFYFSGHGFQRNAGIREGYLATSDTNPEQGNFGLSLFWLRRLLQESPIRQRIVILDCCHSGEILNFLEADPGACSGTDRLFMAASREFEAAYESLESPFSVFTQAVLKGLDPHGDRGVVGSHGLISQVSQRLKGELQQPLFESSGSDIILTRAQSKLAAFTDTLPTYGPSDLNEASSIQCPYPGLVPFSEGQGDQFFGREELTRQLLERVNSQPLSAIIGASGIGKTSLVQAGLIYQLRQGQCIPGSDRWPTRYLALAHAPLQQLAAAFVDSGADSITQAEQLQRAEQFLRQGKDSLSRLAQASLPPALGETQSSTDSTTTLQTVTQLQPSPSHRCAPARFVLILDQFESLFAPGLSDAVCNQRDRVLQCLDQAIAHPTPALSLVIVSQTACQAHLKPYPALADALARQSLWLGPMTYDQIKGAITKPAQQAGLTLEPNLLYSILLDVAGAPGELALLQQTLVELWRQREIDQERDRPRLTMAAYTKLGGIRNLLGQRATHIFEQLDAREKQVAQRIFLTLCELGEGAVDSQRRAHISELINCRFPVDLVTRILNRLAREQLIVIHRESLPTPAAATGLALPEGQWPGLGSTDSLQTKLARKLASPRPDVPSFNSQRSLSWRAGKSLQPASKVNQPGSSAETIDIVHESLIRSWGPMRQWLSEKRDTLRHQRKLEGAAKDWQQHGCPRHTDYLLSGRRLSEAEVFWRQHREDLSGLAERYILASRKLYRRHRFKARTLALVVPGALICGMTAATNQSEDRTTEIAQTIARQVRSLPQQLSTLSNWGAERVQQVLGHWDIPAQGAASIKAALQIPLNRSTQTTARPWHNTIGTSLRSWAAQPLANVPFAQSISTEFTPAGGGNGIASILPAQSVGNGWNEVALPESLRIAIEAHQETAFATQQPVAAIVWIGPDGTVTTYPLPAASIPHAESRAE
ncbi:MAG: caspase family protein [Cyanobacteria bacterium P01_D01_bin.128]